MFSKLKCFWNRLSDLHKLNSTVLKVYFQNQKQKVIKYRNHKKIDNNLFRNDLLNEWLSKNVQTKHICDRHAPLKEKHVRCNQATLVNKNLKKAIMKRSRLLNKFRQGRTISSYIPYKKQRNICVKLLRKAKKAFSNNLAVKPVTDNKQF